MESAYRTERLDADRESDVARAAELLRAGETVAFPTETVYGLGASALSAEAVERVFVAKGRPYWDPLIVHVSAQAMLAELASVNAWERQLMAAFWPGPLTLLLARTAQVPDVVTAGRPKVGVRMPRHPAARRLIELAGVPVAAPSANRFGHTSPTSARHVLEDLDGRIAAVLDGGNAEVGVESTVCEVVFDAGGQRPYIMVYRPGAVSAGMLEELGIGRVESFKATGEASPASLPSPGVGLRHYAPMAALTLVPIDAHSAAPVELALGEAIDAAVTKDGRVGVMLPKHWYASAAELVFRWGSWNDPAQLAQRLFAGLRELDERGATAIVCPLPEPGGLNDAIRDRLLKAARPA